MKNIVTIDERKLRGGYYTPKEICDFLVDWAVSVKNAAVFEPSCGDGQFIQSIVNKYDDTVSITGVELFAEEAKKARKKISSKSKSKVVSSDVFSWYLKNRPDKKFDAVIGNPPFIRYQNFPEEHRSVAFKLMAEEGLSPNRLTNSWVPFVVLATKSLKPGGKLALVLPAEILQVTYARDLRKYLSSKYKNIEIITFKKLVSREIQQEIVLILGEREDQESSNISLVELSSFEDLKDVKNIFSAPKHKILNHDNEKWTRFYLSPEELATVYEIEKSKDFTTLGQIADVDVGVVTGNNKFFIVNEQTALDYGIKADCAQIIGRSNHLIGIRFLKSDYKNISKLGEKTLLFNPGKKPREALSTTSRKYIDYGEKNEANTGYKCQIRMPYWWNVPSTLTPDAFMWRQIHNHPKIIANDTNATSTDTVHRVKIKSGIDPGQLACAFINSVTFAFAEIKGRSYGGGVLELEPTEAENLPLPNIINNVDLPIDRIDKLLRDGNVNEALDIVDSIVLKDAGLSDSDIETFRNIWIRLRDRRVGRGKKAPATETQYSNSIKSEYQVPLVTLAWGGKPL